MSDEASGNPYPEGSGEHLLYAIFGELPGPDACECGMPTECPPPPAVLLVDTQTRRATVADPYENKAKLGRIVLDAAKAAIHDDSNPDLARVNAILTCEVFVSALVDAGCMITRISTARDHREEDEPVQSYRCPRGCDCSCCYGYPDRDCHCFTYPCNCGGGPAEHGAAVGGVTGEPK